MSPAMATANTRKVEGRRTLRFGRLSDILADIESLGEGWQLESLGNWTPAQNVDHVALVIKASLDGFGSLKVPLPLRLFGKLIRSATLNKPMSPGFRMPGGAKSLFAPPADIAWDDAVSNLRSLIHRVEHGERMTEPSPLLGPLSHEEWEQLHCRHAEMHLSFIRLRAAQ